MNSQNKKIIIASSIVVLLASLISTGIFFSKKANNSFSNSTTTLPLRDSTTISTTTTTTKQELNYLINNLNKKEGDVFSIPDLISFNISPSVERVKLTITDISGSVLYFETITGSTVNKTVYLDAKISEGSKGKIKIEGIIAEKTVISRELGVVF